MGEAQFHASQWGVGAFEWVKLTPPICSGHKALSQHPVWVLSCPASPPPGWPHVNPRGAVLSGSYILVNHGFVGIGEIWEHNRGCHGPTLPGQSWPLEIKPGEGTDKM